MGLCVGLSQTYVGNAASIDSPDIEAYIFDNEVCQERVSGSSMRTIFKVVVKQKTDKAHGLTMPPALLARAKEDAK